MDLAGLIVQKLGIDPTALRNALNQIVNDARIVRDNVLAGKSGFQEAVAHFDKRFRIIENELADIKRRLPPSLIAPQFNGADHDERQPD